ncbi:MAG TPA: hypothetical protein VFG73_02410 [Rhodanobacteraceae bacterium]|nr:hypothetical protein [Rhodanobacteraceae bacterium]
MSQYTAEQVEAMAEALDSSPRRPGMATASAMLRAYAATLRRQIGRADTASPAMLQSLIESARCLGVAQKSADISAAGYWGGQVDKYAASLKAAIAQQGEAVGEAALQHVREMRKAAPGLPPRPPLGTSPAHGQPLERWGFPNGIDHPAARCHDGYWTPWHIAQAALDAFSTWQPIETAPKDGSRVLTCFRGVDLKINRFNNPDRHARGYFLGGNGWEESPPNRQPTHWMHIPRPPAEVPS